MYREILIKILFVNNEAQIKKKRDHLIIYITFVFTTFTAFVVCIQFDLSCLGCNQAEQLNSQWGI